MLKLSLKKHDILSFPELDDAVHQVQLYALEKGMIPIARSISRPLADGRHEIPGVHAETGAVKGMGRIARG